MHSQLLGFWGRYCPLDFTHREWVLAHAGPVSLAPGQRLFGPAAPRNTPRCLYFVCQGLLATLWWDEHGRRCIDRFLPPGDSSLTTQHLYTQQLAGHDIVALRPSSVLRIPADSFKAYKEASWEASVLSSLLEYKKLKQYRAKARLMLAPNHVMRYMEFYRQMASLRNITSQREQASYLGISKMTITRALELIRNHR